MKKPRYKKCNVYKHGMMNKRGEAVSITLLVLLSLLGLVGGFVIGDTISEVDEDFTEGLIATLENSYVPNIIRIPVSTNGSTSGDMYFARQTDELAITVGLVQIEWSVLGNLNDGVNFTTAMASNARKFFLNIGNSSQIIDPMNNTNCHNSTLLSGFPGYFCSFSYQIPQTPNEDAAFNVVQYTITPTNHARNLYLVTIEPRDRPTLLSTTSSISEFYFGVSKTIWVLILDVMTKLYLLFKIVLYAGLSALALFLLYFVYRVIARPPRRRRESEEQEEI